MKPYYIDGPFDAAERPFECEFPPELDELLHGTTYYGFKLYASSSSSPYTMDAQVTYSHTHEAGGSQLVDQYLDEFAATGRQPNSCPFGNISSRPPRVVLLCDVPLTLQDGYQCYHVAAEKLLSDGSSFSAFHAKALIGDARVDFKFNAPERVEAWKDRWLKILMSFQLCEGIENIVEEPADDADLEEFDEDFCEFENDGF